MVTDTATDRRWANVQDLCRKHGIRSCWWVPILSATGGVLGEAGKEIKQFGWIHQIACPSENELYVAELLNWRVQKLILEPAH